jgi:segregation and condensation protein A
MNLMEAVETAVGGRRFKLNDFEGPLDLLLYLIRKNEVNIYDIPIARITEQYLDYLRSAEAIDLEDLTEFHVMAAMLLLIKSRTLLPVEVEDDGELTDPRQYLVERLIEYQKFKKLTDLMEEKEKDAEWALERRKLQHNLPFADEDIWEKIDVWNLMRTFAELVRNISSNHIVDLYEEVSVNEKITLLSEMLEARGECHFHELIVRAGSVMDIVCAFLAILESVKTRMIVILQNRMFGDILIKMRPESSAEGSGMEN